MPSPLLFGQFPHAPVPLCVTACVLVAASTDIVARRIPNWLVGFGALAALIVQVWLRGIGPGLGFGLGGLVAGMLVLLPFYALRGMAAGDVKVMSMIGAWVGYAVVFDVAIATFLIGGLWSLLMVLFRGRMRQLAGNLRNMVIASRVASLSGLPRGGATELPSVSGAHSVGTIPYGVSMAIATVGILFLLSH